MTRDQPTLVLPPEQVPTPASATTDWDNLPAEWGPYDQVTKVAVGGMGMVYRARHRALDRVEAVKVLRAGAVAGPVEAARFKFEAEAAAGLDHPNIVPVHGGGVIDGLPYLAMKWVDGGELSALRGHLQADPVALARVIEGVARAVHHAHTQGILHRDLKPANVLMDAAGTPHVTDFGLARRSDAADGLTVTGSIVGTPHYMAPEQARGDRRPTTALDVYGVGAILYYLLTGRPPFDAATVTEVLRQVADDAPAPPRTVAAGVDRDLEAICLKCLEKTPADRYPSAAAAADDLARYARGESISVRPPGIAEWFARELRKTPAPFPGYVWQVKVWFGVIMVACQAAVTGVVLAGGPVGLVWLAQLGAWAGSLAALHLTMAKKFTRLPATEQHSVMVAVGLVIAHVLYSIATLPLTGPATQALAIYPALAAGTGLAFFVIGTTHWGRFYWYGVGMMALALPAAAAPKAAPLLYAAAFAAAVWHWAYAVMVTFGGARDQ